MKPRISKEKFIEELNKVDNYIDLAKSLGISKNTVSTYFKRYKIVTPIGFYANKNNDIYIRKCPECSLKMEYSHEQSFNTADKNHGLCRSCSIKGERNGFYNKKHSDNTKQKMSDNHADFSGDNNPFRKACLKNPELVKKSSIIKQKEWAELDKNKRYKRSKRTIYKDISKYQWTRTINNAKIRNIEFNITPEYAWGLLEKQNFKCKLSNVDIEVKSIYEITASIDRIDSSIGYIVGNIQWVHKYINLMKNNLSNQDFIDICKCVASSN